MVAGGLQAATNAPAEPKQPNVLLVTIDTLRADRIGAYGFGPAHTPVLDRLAREGVRCEHAICQLPQTDPSHAALMTGLYASTSGVRTHMLDKLRPGTPTLAGIFQAAGYQTAGIYSWVSLDAQFCGLDRGFQTYQGYVLNRGAVFGNPALEQAAAAYRQVKAALPVVQTVDQALGTSADYEATMDGRADVTNQAVFAWLDAHAAAGPFFLWVHYYDPHYPYSPPPGYDHVLGLDYRGTIDGSVDTIHQIENGQLHPTPADLARLGELYQGEIAFVDAQLGALLDHLGRVGVAEDTIVVVAGDHGESFGEHGDWAHGLRVFETEIRVPLLLHYPPRLPAGVVVTAPVQLIDVLPTLLDLSGLKAKQLVQGTSLLPLLDGTDPGDSRAAFTELADRSYLSVLTWGDWKLVRDTAKDRLQLYHLTGDESERSDLAATQPQTTREMLARLQDMIDLAGAR
jgi:arylsulfatase A-like enzyme